MTKFGPLLIFALWGCKQTSLVNLPPPAAVPDVIADEPEALPPILNFEAAEEFSGRIGVLLNIVPSELNSQGLPIVSCKLRAGSTLPAGLVLNSETCEISGTPTALATSTELVLVAENLAGESNEARLYLSIARNFIFGHAETGGITYTPTRGIGDLNGDSILDLVMLNGDGSTLHLGNGDGTFTYSHQLVSVGGLMNPTAATVGDFNGDDLADIAIQDDSCIPTVYLGKSLGAFHPGQNFISSIAAVSCSAQSIDVNNDGFDDLVITGTDSTDYFFGVVKGQANGSFGAVVEMNLGSNSAFALGDFDGDTFVDAYVGGGRISWNDGSGNFSAPTPIVLASGSFAAGSQVLTGSLDGNDIVDLITYSAGAIRNYRGNANRIFSASFTNGPATCNVFAVGEFNGDGKTDAYCNGAVWLASGTGGAMVTGAADIREGYVPFDPTPADFNNDGLADFIDIDIDFPFHPVYLNKGARKFDSVSVTRAFYSDAFFSDLGGAIIEESDSVAMGDLNGDGRADIVIADQANDSVRVILVDTSGYPTAPVKYATDIQPTSVKLADLNADGFLDMVTAVPQMNLISIYLGVGDGTFGAETLLSSGYGAIDLALGDLNSDQKIDLAVAGPNEIKIYLGIGNGTFNPTATVVTAAANNRGVITADVDGDSDLDLVFTDRGANRIGIITATPTTFSAVQWIALPSTARRLVAADFNRDGKADIAATLTSKKYVVISSSASGHVVGTPADVSTTHTARYEPVEIVATDFNGDGHFDLAVSSVFDLPIGATRAISLIPGTREGKFSAPMSRIVIGAGTYGFAFGDLNNDQIPDLATFDWNCSLYTLFTK